MKTMKWFCAAALLGGCVEDALESTATTQQALGPQVVAHTVFNGGGAGFGSYEPSTGAQFWVNAYESGAGPSRVAFLAFNFFGPDLTSWGCDPYYWWWCGYTRWTSVWGMGEIPPADFTVAPTNRWAELQTTTGPGFFVQTCSQDGCTFDTPYTFDLTFTGTGFMFSEQSGTRVFSMGVPDWNGQILEFRDSGTYQSQGAAVEGTAFSATITNGNGHIQQTSGAGVIRDLVRTAP